MGDLNISPYDPAFRPRAFSGIIDTESLKTPTSVGVGVVSLEDYVAASERQLHHTPGEPESSSAVAHEEHLPDGITETKEEREHHWFVGSIDQGTTSSRFIIFNGEGDLVASHQIEFENLYPESGYVSALYLHNGRPLTPLQMART